MQILELESNPHADVLLDLTDRNRGTCCLHPEDHCLGLGFQMISNLERHEARGSSSISKDDSPEVDKQKIRFSE